MNSPCKQNGVDCPDRKVGCRSTCTHGWDKYQQQCEERRKNRQDSNAVLDGLIRRKEAFICKATGRKPRGRC